MTVKAADRLMVALDVSTAAQANAIVRSLNGVVHWFKVSHQLWAAADGRTCVDRLKAEGKAVFLDFKYHDIYESVKSAVSGIAKSVSFVTVHGNAETIRGAIAGREAAGVSPKDLRLLAFTALSSFDQNDLREIYNWDGSVEEFMVGRALHAKETGADGVIASGPQVAAVRKAVGPEFLIVTPGVRMEDGAKQDHKRALTPYEAIAAGSDYLVVGRPIIQAPDPVAATQQIVRLMQDAFDQT